jgi:4-amino-4-deoxy-L-arabinose transferase-like glycosyltransferase
LRRQPGQLVAIGLVVAAVAVVGWWGLNALDPSAGPDAAEHIRYAEFYDQTGRLPAQNQNYEYASPPAYALAAVYLQRAARRLALPDGAPLSFLPSPLARLGWLALLALAAGVIASSRASQRARYAATGGIGVLLLLGGIAALSHARAVAWSSGQVLALLSACGLVAVGFALARTLFPQRPVVPVLVAVATFALPVVLREGVVFHPELPFAFLVALAVLVFVRGADNGWPVEHAVAVGALVGVAALTRQTAAVVAVGLGIAAVLLGRRSAVRFVVAAAVALALVAGPWWVYQASRFGNPVQSNLDRPGYMLTHGEPLSFFASLPAHDLVLHPYRNAFENQLLPKFHADLWSDWYGVDRGFWESPSRADKVLASSQSVLGLAADLLALAGLAVLGGPALLRALRRGARGGDTVLVTLTVLTLASWAGFVATLVRYPQASGDPIKSSYLLFLAPAFALFGVAFADRLWRRGRGWRAVLGALCVLYAVSYAGVLVTTY